MRRVVGGIAGGYAFRMTTAEIGAQIVGLCLEGKYVEAVERFYADDVVSVEAMDFGGKGREMHGKAAVRQKNVQWLEDNEVQALTAEGPFASPDGFVVVYKFVWRRRASGERVEFAEAAVYTVLDGKVVREEFFYQPA